MRETVQKFGKNYNKNLVKNYYRELILELHESGKSIREISKLINFHYLPRSKFKNFDGASLSKSTIHSIIKVGLKSE